MKHETCVKILFFLFQNVLTCIQVIFSLIICQIHENLDHTAEEN